MRKKRIEWHPGFYAAIQLDLRSEKRYLHYEREYNLNTKPLEMDLLIIKKPASYKPKHAIAKLFRGHNILEYKSPEDTINIDTLYKVYGYACLYKSYGEHVNYIKLDDITVSLLRESKPVKLFGILAENGTPVAEVANGIYHISGNSIFPTQFIITKELDSESGLWLKSLTQHLKPEQAEEAIRRAMKMKQQGERMLAGSVLDIMTRSNKDVFDTIKEDSEMGEALLELMAPELEASRQEGHDMAINTSIEKMADYLRVLNPELSPAQARKQAESVLK